MKAQEQPALSEPKKVRPIHGRSAHMLYRPDYPELVRDLLDIGRRSLVDAWKSEFKISQSMRFFIRVLGMSHFLRLLRF